MKALFIKYRNKLRSVYKMLGLTNTLLIILILLTMIGFFGKNIKNIFTKIKMISGEQTYTCKQKVANFTASNDASEKCKILFGFKKNDADNHNLSKMVECAGNIKTEYVVNTTTRSLTKYEYWYKFLNITYFKKNIPLENNPNFSGTYDCTIDAHYP